MKPQCHLWSKNWTLGAKTLQKPRKNLSHHTDVLCQLATSLVIGGIQMEATFKLSWQHCSPLGQATNVSTYQKYTKFYRKTTHTGWYHNFKSNHLQYIGGVFTSQLPLYAKDNKIFLIKLVTWDVIFSWSYPKRFTDLVINSKGSSHLCVYPIHEWHFREVQTYREPM